MNTAYVQNMVLITLSTVLAFCTTCLRHTWLAPRAPRNSDLVALLRSRESGLTSFPASNTTKQLQCWAEQDCLLRNCTASYISMPVQPRSTIATAYSHDGSLLASTQCVRRVMHVLQC